MNLNLFNNILHDEKENSFTLNFIKELTEYLNNAKESLIDIQLKQDLYNFLSIDELISKYKISNTFLGNFYQKCNEILEEYSKTLGKKDKFYYVSWNNTQKNEYNQNDNYTIREFSNGKNIREFKIYGKDLIATAKRRYDTKEKQ